MATYLDRILAHHHARAAADDRPLAALRERAEAGGPARDFAGALTAPGMSVVAEVKRRSPSKGDLLAGLDPALLAKAYEAGGAACLSVLTDGPHFGGSADDLAAARAAVEVPVLRKDFTVAERDLLDARIMGADAVLLIVAALDDDALGHLAASAAGLGLSVLVEVHDEAELGRAASAGALAAPGACIGVNQRDLRTFEVDTGRAVRVAAAAPAGLPRVAESGITGPADVSALAAAGFDAVLVGEHLVRSADPEAAVRALLAPPHAGAEETPPCS